MSERLICVIRLRLGFAPGGRTSLTSAGHRRPKSSTRYALSLLLYTASALEQARLAVYKTTTPDFRQALLFGCDSVGIRTQDPQLRRLLLYPTELPNRSVFAFGFSGSDVKSGCKGNDIFWICNTVSEISVIIRMGSFW